VIRLIFGRESKIRKSTVGLLHKKNTIIFQTLFLHSFSPMSISIPFLAIGTVLLVLGTVAVTLSQTGYFKSPATLELKPTISSIPSTPTVIILPRPETSVSVALEGINTNTSGPLTVRHAHLSLDGQLLATLAYAGSTMTLSVRRFNNVTREYDQAVFSDTDTVVDSAFPEAAVRFFPDNVLFWYYRIDTENSRCRSKKIGSSISTQSFDTPFAHIEFQADVAGTGRVYILSEPSYNYRVIQLVADTWQLSPLTLDYSAAAYGLDAVAGTRVLIQLDAAETNYVVVRQTLTGTTWSLVTDRVVPQMNRMGFFGLDGRVLFMLSNANELRSRVLSPTNVILRTRLLFSNINEIYADQNVLACRRERTVSYYRVTLATNNDVNLVLVGAVNVTIANLNTAGNMLDKSHCARFVSNQLHVVRRNDWAQPFVISTVHIM
jgi:hypothetical protein